MNICKNSNKKRTIESNPPPQGIERNVFRELLHSTFDISAEETLMERIFTSWDRGSDGMPLRLESWICGISVFLRGTLFERANFCFRVYDLNADGFITKGCLSMSGFLYVCICISFSIFNCIFCFPIKDEMFSLMKNCLIKQPQDEDPDESVKDLMEIALRKFDVDKDGKVKEQIFCGAF